MTIARRTTVYPVVELDGTTNVVSGYVEVDDQFAAPPRDAVGEAFRASMRLLAAGVVMVTTSHEGRPWGLTISSCCSVSVDPPQILISLRSTSVSRRSILESGRFGISILSARQKALAEFGSAAGAAKFVDDYCHDNESVESPMIAGGLSHLDCTVASHWDVGDHSIIVGRVVRVVFSSVGQPEATGPLLYFNRAFWTVGDEI